MNDTRNLVVTVLLVLAFAALVTVHVATLFGLVKRKHWPDAIWAMVLPPIAPMVAWRRELRSRAILWGLGAAVYIVMLLIAR